MGARRVVIGCIVSLLWAPALHAQQQSPAVVSAGYSAPESLSAAPGQVITLFLRGEPGARIHAAATSLPLPVSLAGYSVHLHQTYSQDPIPAPLFAVYTVDRCFGLAATTCSTLTALTIQIPYELSPNIPRSGRPTNFAALTVSHRGVSGEPFPLDPVSDSIHVLNSCDTTFPPGFERPTDLAGPCKPVVAHLDGTVVTPSRPAAAGETLVLYAFGLGASGGTVRNGEGVRSPIPLTDVSIGFQVGVNLSPVRPSAPPPPAGNSPLPVFAGLTPGQVGLYQIAFVVPPLPASAEECTASRISSNFTVTISRQASFDGAGICVAK
jgi:uncharacterized protein (TIGR03437 family)